MQYPTQDELRELTQSERLKLLEDVWETLTQGPEPLPLHEGHAEELDRRLQAYHDSPDAGSSWEQVRQRIRKS